MARPHPQSAAIQAVLAAQIPIAERISGAGLLATISSTVTVWPRAMAVAHSRQAKPSAIFVGNRAAFSLKKCRVAGWVRT
ncbi:MAG: hypothetical protein R2867_32235 [Caldilineaceae bacterium]